VIDVGRVLEIQHKIVNKRVGPPRFVVRRDCVPMFGGVGQHDVAWLCIHDASYVNADILVAAHLKRHIVGELVHPFGYIQAGDLKGPRSGASFGGSIPD
jgi:hypothetical protein